MTLNAGQLNINNPWPWAPAPSPSAAPTTIDNTSGAAIVMASNNPIALNNTLTFAGSLGAASNLTFGTGVVTMSSQSSDHGQRRHAHDQRHGGRRSTYALTKAGTGTLVLGNTTTYTGGTTISAGTLQIGTGGSVGDLAAALRHRRQRRAGLQPLQHLHLHQVISGTGSVTQMGTGGTLVLNATETYTGTTIISAGTLQIGTGGTTGGLSGNSAVTDNATLAYNRSDRDQSSPTTSAAAGGLLKLGTGMLTLSPTLQHLQRHYAGEHRHADPGQHQSPCCRAPSMRLQRHGTLSFGTLTAITIGGLQGTGNLSLLNTSSTAVALKVGNNGTSTTYSGVLGGTRQPDQDRRRHAGAHRRPTPTAARPRSAAGTLQVGSGPAAGAIPGNVTDNATLAFNRSDVFTYAGNIGGTGNLNQLGAGTLVLTGANTYGGVTTVAAGTLQVGHRQPPRATSPATRHRQRHAGLQPLRHVTPTAA